MRCCVPSCKNDSRSNSKSQGITFHVFPSEPSHRLAWLKVVGKDEWSPRERSAVCSEHFLPTDLYETQSGMRKVRSGAVPVIVKVSDKESCDFKVPVLEVCRICLGVDSKLVPITKFPLEQAFENLTGMSACKEDKLPQMLCTECARRLLNCHRFKDKTIRAHTLMMDLLQQYDMLTLENIKTINREDNQLISTLNIKHNEADLYNVNIDHDQILLEIEKSEMEIQIDSEENKNEVFIDDDDDYEDKDYKENDVTKDISEEYSTEDEVPLLVQKKKKKKREKKVKKDSEPKIDRRRKPFLNNDLNETLFTITNLTVEEQLAEIQKRKDTSNYKNSVFKCMECFKGFLDEDAYFGHMAKHTDQCGEFVCEICKTHFKHPHPLRKHITAHHTQRFSCNQCPYVTTHRQTARLHERWHKGTKYQCPHCPDEFVKFTTYMGHIRIKHPSDFVCQLCGYSFVSEKGIELHKKLKHRTHTSGVPDDGPLCELCNVRFVSPEAFKRHVSVSGRHNTDSSGARESNKPKRDKKAREREKEIRKETGEKRPLYPSQKIRKAEGPIPCEQCGLQLEDSRAYHSHFRRMHPDKNRTNYPSMKTPCMCEMCGKMFQSAALLRDHRWSHTTEKSFSCDLCGKAFRMKQRLVAHRRVHAPRRAYACAVCGKGFSTQSNRQRHMFIHTGLKPYKCEMCGKGFKHASEKRAHITYVHLKKPWPKRARGKRRSDRQGQMQMPQEESTSEMEIVAPVWPSCEQKMNEINILDRPIYFNNIK